MKNYMNKPTPHYQSLLPIAREVRAAVKPFIADYERVYTEPRKDGLRSKFWAARTEGTRIRKVMAGVKAFNAKYPEYLFECYEDAGYWPSICIYITKRK